MSSWRVDDLTRKPAVEEAAPSRPVSPADRDAERAVAKPVAVPTRADLQQAVERLAAFVRELERNLEFRIDEASGRVVVSVIDAASGELIRQIPSEEILRLAARLDAAGLQFLDPRGVRA